MNTDLTHGPVMKTMLRFAIPMILGNLLQQCYNIADTLIVGRFLGAGALAAVGSAFSLMTFLTSILLGLAMGSGTVFSMRFGKKDQIGLREGIFASFALLGVVTVLLNVAVFLGIDWIIWALRTPEDLVVMMREYLERVREKYGYILIDCMPSLGMMTVNALVAADSVLILVQAAYLPIKGLQQLIKTIAMVSV